MIMHTPKEEKCYFEIFSKKEMACLTLIKNQELKNFISEIVKVMNNGIHSPKGGWYGKMMDSLETSLEIKNNQDKLEIKEGIEKYIVVANKLQKPKEGGDESLILGKKQITQHVNVYTTFWMGCFEATLHAFLAIISKLNETDFSDGKEKAYVYTLLQFKNDELFKLLLDSDQLKHFYDTVDKVIGVIQCKTHLKMPYIMSEHESHIGHYLYDQLLKRIFQLKNLKLLVESKDIYIRYIHIQPNILIQYIQAIDYGISKCKDFLIDRNLLDTHINYEKEFLKYPVLSLLKQKKLEMTEVLAFHEQLLLQYKKDDFIELLHKTVKNIGCGTLPNHKLFEFTHLIHIQLFKYDATDPDAPKEIENHQLSEWRRAYLKIIKPVEESKPSELPITAEESKQEFQTIINLKKLNLVMDFKSFTISLPSIIASSFTSMVNNNETNITILIEFFITNHHERNIIYKINQYKTLMDFLTRQVNHKGQIQFFSLMRECKEFHCNPAILKYFNELLQFSFILSEHYPKEIVQAKEMQDKSVQHKTLFQTYIDMLVATKKIMDHQIKKICYYWINLIERDLNRFPFLRKSFSELIRKIDVIIKMIDDPLLNDTWNQISKIDQHIAKLNRISGSVG